LELLWYSFSFIWWLDGKNKEKNNDMEGKPKKIGQMLNKQKWWILAYVVATIIRVVLATPLVHDWDGFVFSESAKNMVQGITPYMTVETNDPAIYPNSDRPMTEQWYGYPPLPLIMFTVPYALTALSGINITPVVENIVLKLPFILGDILCAFLVFRLLRSKNERLAGRAMLLVLFNPLFIWISSVWGMFDIWIVNFILLFFLSLRSKKFLWAGFFLALAPEVKLFPVFFLPAIFVYVIQKVKQNSQRLKFFLAFVLTTLGIVIPFFLSSPQGFMNQNLIMHGHRPPQGIGIVAMFDFVSHIYHFDTSFLVGIGSVLTLSLILVFNLLALVYVKGKKQRLFTIMLLIYTSVLAFNKVVNEQYFVVFVSFLIILAHFPKKEIGLFSRRFLARTEWLATFSVLFAGVILGFHFLTFLPPFISEGYLKASTNYLVFYLSKLVSGIPLYVYPNSVWTYYHLPVIITYLVLIPLVFLCFYIVFKGVMQVFLLRKEIFLEIYSCLRKIKRLLTMKNVIIGTGVLVVVILLSFPFVDFLNKKKAFGFVDVVDEKAEANWPSDPKVGTFYYTWWNNSSLKHDLAGDAWDRVTTSPETGFYTSKNSYFVKHIKQMKEVGIDFAILSYHLYDRERYLTFSSYAEKLGFYFAPLIEMVDILGSKDYKPVNFDGNKFLGFSLTDKSRLAVENNIISAIESNYHSPAFLKIDDRPVVFIYDGHWFFPSWDDKFKKRLTHRIFVKYTKESVGDPFSAISDVWGIPVASEDEMMDYYPQDIVAFNEQIPSAKDYNQAFLLEYEDFWKEIRQSVENKVGPIYLLSTYTQPTLNESSFVLQTSILPELDAFDNEFFYSLSNTWVNWRNITTHEEIMSIWEKQEKLQAGRNKNGSPLFLTTTPTYKDTIVRGELGFEIPQKVNGKSVYDWTWEIALENQADYVLIATWNEFFEGSAIEPTKEYGNFYLEETKKWTDRFRK